MKKKTRAICSGCLHFSVSTGNFRYSCNLWGISSVNYNIAQIIYNSTGKKCPYCVPVKKNKVEDEENISVNVKHNGNIDIKI